jgi:parvulin-like peptidyl-prolyl isomerase
MRFFCSALVFSASVFAQLAQSPQQAKVPDDAVVMTIDGKKYTAGEVRAMMVGLPPEAIRAFTIEPVAPIQTIFMMKYMASEAEKEGLDKETPVKEQLEFQRAKLLAETEMNRHRALITVSADEQKKYYDEHTADFQQAKVRVIYIAFSSGQVKSDMKVLKEPEAKAKIEDLRKQLLGGADFAAVAKENSDDKESAAKGGDFGIVKRTSNQPPEIKNVIFSLKAGDISEPVRLANGFYVFKVDEFTTQPYEELATQIGEKLRGDRFAAWVKGIQNRFTLKVENQDFFPSRTAPPASR